MSQILIAKSFGVVESHQLLLLKIFKLTHNY